MIKFLREAFYFILTLTDPVTNENWSKGQKELKVVDSGILATVLKEKALL